MTSRRRTQIRHTHKHVLAIACLGLAAGCAGESDSDSDSDSENDEQVVVAQEPLSASRFASSSQWTTWSTAYDYKLADVNGDGRADIIGRSGSNVHVGLASN